MMPITRLCLLDYIKETGIKVLTDARVQSISQSGVTYVTSSGQQRTAPAATVVSAFGYKSYNPLEESARKYCANVAVIGGAVKAGNALTAAKEGYEAALAL